MVVDQVAEGEIDSATNVAAREFSLGGAGGPGIAEVVFSSEGTGLTTFNAMLVDDLVLTTNKSAFPPGGGHHAAGCGAGPGGAAGVDGHGGRLGPVRASRA